MKTNYASARHALQGALTSFNFFFFSLKTSECDGELIQLGKFKGKYLGILNANIMDEVHTTGTWIKIGPQCVHVWLTTPRDRRSTLME